MLSSLAQRLKQAARVLLNGAPHGGGRSEVPPLTPEEVAEAKIFFPMEKFFLFGHARSGTTLLMRLLDVHPQVHCSRQAHFFTRPPYLHALVADPAVEEWLSRGSVRWNRGRDLSAVVLRAAADFILEREARRHNAQIVGDKSPNSINDGQAVQLAHQIYPDARIVFIVRDGRDAVLSHRFQAFIDSTQHLTPQDWEIRTEFESHPERFKSRQRSLFTEQGIREYARGWVRNLQTTASQCRQLYPGQYHALRYEDLLADPVGETQKTWSFLGARPDFEGVSQAVQQVIALNRDARWQQQKAGQLAEAIPKGQVGSWQEYFSDRDRQVFQEIAGDMLAKWKYPP